LNGKNTYPSKYNEHYFQFCTYKALEDNVLPTSKLEGVFEGKPVLLSRFEELPTFSIFEDMIMEMEAKQPMSTLPALTFSDAEMMVSSVTEADIEDTFK